MAERIFRYRDLREAGIGRRRFRIFVDNGGAVPLGRGIYASGGVGFIHDMVTAAGGANVFADLQQEAVQATTEQIIARRPEVIIELVAEPMAPADVVKERTVWKSLASVPAVRNNRIHIIADRRTVIPGPRVAEGVEVIAATLHPER